MRHLHLTTDAQHDLDEIAHYVATSSGCESIGLGLATRLVARCERLASLPGILGTERPDIRTDIRSTPWRGYVIYFRYLDEDIQIVAVLHGKRDAIAHFEDRSFPDDD